LLRRQEELTSILQTSCGRWKETLADVLDRLGLYWTRAGNRFFISTATLHNDVPEERGYPVNRRGQPLSAVVQRY